MNTPDHWAVIKITGDGEIFYKILAGWYGGYAHGDSWKLNSGVSSVEEADEFYLFHGESGSVYKCHKESEGLRSITAIIFDQLKERFGDKINLELAKDMEEQYMLKGGVQ